MGGRGDGGGEISRAKRKIGNSVLLMWNGFQILWAEAYLKPETVQSIWRKKYLIPNVILRVYLLVSTIL